VTSLGVQKKPIISPLRYPGGKGALYPRLRSLIRANDLSEGTYVEPYAGGAGAGLALLVTGQVRRIVINDLDPKIYAFWRAVVNHTAEFSELLAAVNVTVKEWAKQKDLYLNAPHDDYLNLGFATFFLNRTNRSGALRGGPIGGRDQCGNYKIDARFNKDTLLERVRLIGLYAKQINVRCEDGEKVIRRYAQRGDVLIYADPPYFEKAGSLYMNAFEEGDHSSLADCLNDVANGRWVLTYDDVPQIDALYGNRRIERISLNYSAHRVVKAREVLIVSDGLQLPETNE
jgi:DNA adenine methylase